MNLSTLNKKQLINLVEQKLAPQEGSLLFRGRSKTPSLASSRRSSRSRSRSKSRKGGFRRRSIGGAAFRSGQWRGKFLKSQVNKLTPIVRAKEVSDKKLSLVKSGYFADQKDQKGPSLQDVQKENDNLVKELQLAVAAVKAGLGDRPIRMRLSVPFVITTTVTTGVTNTVTVGGGNNRVKPSDANEWSTCAALFEEYKMLGGEAVFGYANPVVLYAAGAFSNQTANNMLPTIAYDADDSTAATGVNSLTQLAQHEVLYPLMHGDEVVSATGVSATFGPREGCTHRFKFHIPRGNLTDGTNSAGTQWVAVPDAVPHGYLKFYHVGLCAAAKDTGAGILYYDVEFRCRV